MKLRFLPASFKQRILLGFCGLILLFLGAMVLVDEVGIPGTTYKGRTALRRASVLGDLEKVSGLIELQLMAWYEERRSDANDLAKNLSLREHLEDNTRGGYDELTRELAGYRSSHPPYQFLGVLDPQGKWLAVATCDAVNAGRIAEADFTREQLARLMTPGYQETVDLHQAAQGAPRLRICRQIELAGNAGKVAGVLVVESDIERAVHRLLSPIGNLLTGEWQFIIASDFGGTLVRFAQSGAEDDSPARLIPELNSFAPVALAMAGTDGPYEGMDYRGLPVLAFHRQLRFAENAAMAVVLTMDRKRAFQPLQEDLTRRFLLWLGLLLAAVGLSFLLAKQISGPIHQLVAVAKRVEAGDLTGRITATEPAEIGSFAAVFNHMVERLAVAQHDLEAQVLTRTRELEVLSARKQAILTAVPDIIVEINARKEYTWSNRAALEFFGSDVIGQPAARYLAREQEVDPKLKEMLERQGGSTYMENWQRRKDGEVRLLAWWCSELKDARGDVVSRICTARDITERRQAEETLRQKYADLERFSHLTMGREARMIELKKEINRLLQAAGQPAKYRIVDDPPT